MNKPKAWQPLNTIAKGNLQVAEHWQFTFNDKEQESSDASTII